MKRLGSGIAFGVAAGAIVVAGMSWGSAASAQTQPTTPPAEVVDTTTDGETQASEPVSPDRNTPKPAQQPAVDPDSEEVVVVGFRESLRSASAIKRNSDSILDAVVAEDIGKLPNNTAAETVARLPGVQVNRTLDEVTGVLVRGLPDVTTTYNGRDIYTTDGRGVNLTDFPAGALSGLEVYKSGTADLLEPGLAGLINVRTAKPFDFKGFIVAGGVRAVYADRAKKFDPNANLLVSGRADTGIGEVGILAQVAVPVAHPYVSYRYNGSNVIQPTSRQTVSPASVGRTFLYPDFVGLQYSQGKRSRPGANIAMQWKPAQNLEVYGDLLYQSFRGRYVTDSFGATLVGDDPALTNVVIDPNQPGAALSLTKVGGFRPDINRAVETGNLNGFQYGGGMIWRTGRAKLSTDLAYTSSKYYDVYMNLDQATIGNLNGRPAPTMNLIFNKDKGVSIDLPGFNSTDPANYVVRGLYEQRYVARGSGWQWRADLDLEVDESILNRIQIGVRYTTREIASNFTNRYAYLWPLGDPLSAFPVDYEKTAGRFRDQGAMPYNQWLAPTRESVVGNRQGILNYTRAALQRLNTINPGAETGTIARFTPNLVPFNPADAYTGGEKTYTFYHQAKYGFELGSIGIDGMVGFRVVNVVGDYRGTEVINQLVLNGTSVSTIEGPRRPISRSPNDLDVLPNVSIRMKFSDELQLRLGMTKTRTRPSFGQLNPSFNLNLSDPRQLTLPPGTAGFSRFAATGSSGNIDLKSLTSKNYDASLEWYFGKTGAASAAVFYRDVFGFISGYQRIIADPQYGLVQIFRPENAGSGRIKGAELSFQSSFDFLPGALSGFGVQLNGTYVDARNQQPAIFGQNRPLIRIAGVSKWAGNATLFYEYGKISTRFAYNIRSRWVEGYVTVTDTNALAGDYADPVSRLDFSFGYSPIQQLTLSLDVSNVLARPYTNYNSSKGPTFRRDVRDESRFIGLGARFRF